MARECVSLFFLTQIDTERTYPTYSIVKILYYPIK